MISPSADVDDRAQVASSAQVWDLAHVRRDAVIGENCVIGRGATVDVGVVVGANSKIQNNALVYAPATIEQGVFIGPAAVLTNDSHPRAVNPDWTMKEGSDWDPKGVTVRRGASIGAGAIVLAGVEIGEWALVGAGSVVTDDVQPHALVVGAPARRIGWVGRTGRPLTSDGGQLVDPVDGTRFRESDGRLVEQ